MGKEKKWQPPNGWEATSGRWNDQDVITGVKTYDDGERRELAAHSEDEFDTLAEATDRLVQAQRETIEATA